MARPSTALVGAAALAVAVLGPALGPGYVLNADEVFVPEQDLLPWMLGAGGGLPRSVPQDAVVAVLSGPVPGWVWEKSALVALVALLAVGVGRLALPRGRGAAVVAALVAVWSGYVAERLLLGHWSLLLALAALPWALDAARRCREGRPAAGAAWLLWLALASLTVTGGLLVVGLTLPVLLWRGGAGTGRHRAAVALLGGVLQLPWLVPALMRGSVVAAGADVFAARSEGPWGVLVTVLGTGGVWNADAVPGSRSTGWAVVLGLLVLVVAAVGARDVVAVVGRPIALSLTVGSVLGLAWACASAWAVTQPAVAWIVATLPGGGVLRDAHKWIAPWVILLALAAGLGAARLARAARARGGDLVAARAVLVAVALLPVVAMPDLAWGAAGRLTAVAYPDDLGEVRAVLAAQPEGDAVSLPWQAFRRFPWNHEGRTSLDPVPRAMPRTTLVSGTLVVRRGDELVSVAGDDPRALRIDAALEAGTPLGPVLAEEGVAYAVVASDLPDATDDLPTGSVPLYEGASFSLYRLALPADPVPPTGPVAGLAAAALAAAVLVAMGAAVARVRARHP